jgi:hypothetical protein
MASTKLNPAARAGADRARKSDCLAAVDSENTASPFHLQQLRARFLSRRCRLSPIAAGVVAGLAFTTEASR